MKANLTNLRKVMKLSASAHKVEYHEFYDMFRGEMPALKSQAVPMVADVMSIARAFFGPAARVSTEDYIGYTVAVPGRYMKEVDMETLALALTAEAMQGLGEAGVRKVRCPIGRLGKVIRTTTYIDADGNETYHEEQEETMIY